MSSVTEKMDVPIIAFFGTRGGVGKTTITSRFSEFVSYGPNNPNVLMIDFDVDHRGLTVLWTRGRAFTCQTIHDYMTQQITTLDKAVDVTEEKRNGAGGKLFLIPSAHSDSRLVFKTTALLDYGELVNVIIELIKGAIVRYDISCVVIDCGPIINPYTAAAAHIADQAFIIGQNEPISYDSLSNYSYKIKEFYEGFNSSKMAVILNKVRGDVKQGYNAFAVIPFTLEVIDISEGLENVDRIRVSLFESYIHFIVAKVFRKDHPSFVPSQGVVLNDELKHLGSNPKSLYRHKNLKLLRIAGPLALVFFLVLVTMVIVKFFYDELTIVSSNISESTVDILFWVGLIGFLIALIPYRIHAGLKKHLKKLEQGGVEYVTEMLRAPNTRARLETFRKWMAAMEGKN